MVVIDEQAGIALSWLIDEPGPRPVSERAGPFHIYARADRLVQMIYNYRIITCVQVTCDQAFICSHYIGCAGKITYITRSYKNTRE